MAVKEPPWSLTNTHISLAMKHASWFIIEKTFWLLIRFSYDIIDMDVKEPPLSLTYLSFCRQIFFLSPQSEHTGLYHALDPTWIIYVPIQNLWLPLVKTQTIGPYNQAMVSSLCSYDMDVKEPPLSLTHLSLAMKHTSWFIIDKIFWLLIRFSLMTWMWKNHPYLLPTSLFADKSSSPPQSEHTGPYCATSSLVWWCVVASNQK